jgi:uncharacterized protein (TIGR01777 family)
MRFVMAGGTGFLGRAWTAHLQAHDHEVVWLVRREAQAPHEVRWDPYAGRLDREVIESADVVVNLAGAPLAHWPWTASYRRTFRDSRVATTRVLADAVAGSERKPALVAQSGIAAYGDRGAEVIDEETPTDADTFMGQVVRDWEAATTPAAEAGARVVTMRTAVVLDRSGGALRLMATAFKAGAGGRIGRGDQYFPVITLHDWLGAATFLAYDDRAHGAYNVSGPDPSTNAEFTRVLGKALRRPTVVPVPAWPLRALAPIPAGELLSSLRVEPHLLEEQGYAFAHCDVEDRVRAALEGYRPVTPRAPS